MGDKAVAQKLLVKPGHKLILIDAPAGYELRLGDLPEGVRVERQWSADADVVQCFVTSLSQLEELLPRLRGTVKPAGLVWVTYPKGSARAKTDVNRDSIRALAGLHGLEAVAIFSVDEVWSALRLKRA